MPFDVNHFSTGYKGGKKKKGSKKTTVTTVSSSGKRSTKTYSSPGAYVRSARASASSSSSPSPSTSSSGTSIFSTAPLPALLSLLSQGQLSPSVAKLTADYLKQEATTPNPRPMEKGGARIQRVKQVKPAKIQGTDLALALEGIQRVRGKKGMESFVGHGGGDIAFRRGNKGPLRTAKIAGKPTLGTPSLKSVVKSAERDKLQVNKKGKVTTPQTRRAARELHGAIAKLRKARKNAVPSGVAGVVYKAAKAHGVDPNILWGVFGAESSFGKAGRFGLTADYGPGGVGPSLEADANRSAELLRNLYDQGGSWDYAVRAYNAGPGNLAAGYSESYIRGLASQNPMPRSRPVPKGLVRNVVGAKAQARRLNIPTPAAAPGRGEKGPGVGGPGRIPSVVAIGLIAEKRFGLNVGENPAFGGVEPVHVAGSYHYRTDAKGRGEAIDVSGDPAAMMAFDKFVARKWGQGVTELFYDPGISIKDGQITSAIGGHGDHVHVAVAQPGEHFPGGLAATAGPGGAMFVGAGSSPAAAAASANAAARAAAKGAGLSVSPISSPTAASAVLPTGFSGAGSSSPLDGSGATYGASRQDVIGQILRRSRG